MSERNGWKRFVGFNDAFVMAWKEFAEISGIEKPADNPIAYKAFVFAWNTCANKCLDALEFDYDQVD